MRWFKLFTSALILAVIALFAWQNVPTFQTPLGFSLNLYVTQPVAWQHHLYTLLGIAAGLGFVIGVLLLLRPYFRIRRQLAQERQEKQELASKIAESPVSIQPESPPAEEQTGANA